MKLLFGIISSKQSGIARRLLRYKRGAIYNKKPKIHIDKTALFDEDEEDVDLDGPEMQQRD